jgi:hypothetical protein
VGFELTIPEFEPEKTELEKWLSYKNLFSSSCPLTRELASILEHKADYLVS